MPRAKGIFARLLALVAISCATTSPDAGGDYGRLTSRPRTSASACAAGTERLALSSGPDAYLYVPERAAGRPAPFMVFLHGAGGAAETTMEHTRPVAERYGFIVLVPGSMASTWDGIRDERAIDTARIDEALSAAFERCPVDRGRIAVGGFSDGASYALTLGLANGDLFSHIIAFAPCGWSKLIRINGKPAVFVSHGKQDQVLPIDKCSLPAVAALRRAEYDVRFIKFEGKHEIPENVAADAFSWFLGRRATAALPQ